MQIYGDFYCLIEKIMYFCINMEHIVSRTKRTIQNSRMSLMLFLFQIVVGFYSRKVFLDCLGAEVLGVNTTLGNILSFLNLTELGIGIAMVTSLYKPIQAQDYKTINEILTVQGYLYRRIALLLCLLSVPILIAMPWLFPSTECGLLYVYMAYVVFLGGSLSGYLWNYRQVLIGADQKNFKLMPWIHVVRYVKIFLQIFFLLFTPFGVWAWLLMELLGDVLSVLVINRVLYKEYPWLQSVKIPAKELLKKYQVLIVKTKQIFIHKIGLFVLEQTAPLIIYALVSLTMVTYYGNYMVLIGYTTTLMNVIFEGMGASIGNLVAENNKRHTLEVFWELFTSRFWVSSLACFGLYLFMSPFITIWIGEKYVLGDMTLILMLITMFLRLTRSVTDSFNHAYQLFGDVWAPAVEGVINLGCSFWLGSIWGLNGILAGVALSLLATGLFWKPYYLFSRGLKTPTFLYYRHYVLLTVVIGFSMVGSLYLFKSLIFVKGNGIVCVVTRQLIIFLTFFLSSYLLLMCTTKSMRHFNQRVVGIIKKE